MKIGKSLSKILKNLNKPLWLEYVFFHKIFSTLLFEDNTGVYILKEQWDNLIILDDCRYDAFKEEFLKRKMKGKLEYRISRGTSTPSFLFENFDDRKYDDIVYVTANPFIDKLLKNKFYKIIPVWKDGWDEIHHTVPPQIMYRYALYTMVKYPTKRIIIHFLQPHSPYPNGTGEVNAKEGMYNLLGMLKDKKFKAKYKLDENYYAEQWPYIGIKPLKINKLKEGYKQNLQLVMPYIKKLIDILPGKTVVTADHGEAFGEKIHPLIPIRVYGHITGIRIPAIVKVPWLVVEPREKNPPKNIEKLLIQVRMIDHYDVDDMRKKIKSKINELKTKGRI